ncbi:MAG: hypothetical protein EPN93_13180 [Spirochaetes bacterium]|nr:MAG: hypothetical protein EPN93_13180 [Spirochaetota bacterium]
MHRETESRKVERKAKLLLMQKEIPPAKMNVVRALMNNPELLPEERYNAIISLIRGCPDKPQNSVQPARTRTLSARNAVVRTIQVQPESHIETNSRSLFLLYRKYRSLKLFKTRYIIHAANRFGFAIRRRLVPSPRLMKALRELSVYQEKVAFALPDVMIEILKDPAMEDPTIFNYIRLLHRWLMRFPLVSLDQETLRWMDRSAFESELRGYLYSFFSFQRVQVDLCEQIISVIEGKLRMLPEYRKQEVFPNDPVPVKNEKERNNSLRERQVIEYLMLLRSFIPPGIRAENRISAHLSSHYGVSSFGHLLMLLMEILVFWKEIEPKKLEEFLEIDPPRVSKSEWDYSMDELRRFGKDEESRRKRRLERVKEQLIPYEELYRYLSLQPEGQSLLFRAFEIQWKSIDRRQKDYDSIFEDDFFTFLDVCLNYFKNCFTPFLDGTTVYFLDEKRNPVEGKIFDAACFAEDLATLSQLTGEMHEFRSKNPTFVLSRSELKLIFQGKMRSLAHMERFIRVAGDLLYRMAAVHHRLLILHQRWIDAGGNAASPIASREPLTRKPSVSFDEEGVPIPYYQCTVRAFEREASLSRTLHDKPVAQAMDGGLIGFIAAFAYQLALECMNEELYNDLAERKNLLRELKELSGKNA